MSRPTSPATYLRDFFRTFLRECYKTWRQELLASLLVSLVSYGYMAHAHDPAAWSTFKVALISSALVLAAFALWHFARTPFLLHRETVERMNQESLSALENQKKDVRRISPADWRELSDKFSKMVPFQNYASFQTSEGVTRWNLHDKQCKALCTLAGTMLVASESLPAHLPDIVKRESDPIARWLEYLKETTTAASYRREYVTEIAGDGRKIIHLLGSIDNVARESTAVCLTCCALELQG